MTRSLSILLVSLGLLLLVVPPVAPQESPEVMVATLDGVINPVAAEFITHSIEKANAAGAEAFVLELDTPGGLVTSMRDIVKSILGSEVPVVVYVAPPGARAASAGTFITLSAHVAAMAPQTNIGAAHPVAMGQKMDKTMAEKAVNDSAAYIKSLAERRGRNAQWAEDAVRKSVSATEEEALKLGVIDLVSANLPALLSEIDGMKVETAGGERVLRTKGAAITRLEMSLRHRVLDVISDPNIAYILMLLGFYGIFFELTNPGAVFPGVVGGICLILAFYAFQTLPINYAGILLILLGVVLFILEIKVTSYGALTIGGIIAMVLGSLMLFEDAGPFVKLSIYTILPAVVVTALFFTVVIGLAWKAFRSKPTTGREGLVGLEGTAATEVTPAGGTVKVHGEIWSAVSEEPIQPDEKVVVESVEGLKLKVRKK
ncbi:MAG: nodulation protein NfeD [Nitrospirota bacterium]|jgi:membrane-bound serine protease (ClpP class)